MKAGVGIELNFDIRNIKSKASLAAIKLTESVVEDSLKMKVRLRHGRARFVCHLMRRVVASQLPSSVMA